jgi:uroporphyrinogen-III synthase
VARSPQLQVGPPDFFNSLDESIENLFGYDWIIFINKHAVDFFVDRFAHLGHDTDEFDSLRVCAIGKATLAALESRQVHVDVMTRQFAATRVVQEIATYIGSREDLARRNFLLPQALIGGAYLKPALEEADARGDVVATYQTVSHENALSLIALQTILSTGGIDGVIFDRSSELEEFAQVFDTFDLSRLLAATKVICNDEETLRMAKVFAGSGTLIGRNTPSQLAEAVAAQLDS